jgi:hypothetical protein
MWRLLVQLLGDLQVVSASVLFLRPWI